MPAFTNSLFSDISGFGRPDPNAPAQEAFGSSNPLARSVGGMLGMDMSTGKELAAQGMSKITAQKGTPEYLMQALEVAAKYEPDPQKKVAIMAKMTELQQAAAAQKKAQEEATATQTASVTNRASVASIVQTKYPALAEAIINEQGAGRTDALKAGLKIVEEEGTKQGSKGKAQFDAWDRYIDSEGNIFNIGVKSDPDTQVSSRVVVPAGAVLEPVGTLSLASISEKGGQQEAKEFGKLRVQSAMELPELKIAYDSIGRALELVDSIETGGPINTAGTALESFIGTKSADKQELEVLLGESMYQRLKPLFGGVISEGERAAVEKMYGSLSKGNEANRGVLRYMRSLTEKAYKRADLVRSSATFSEYNTLLDKLYPEDLGSEPTKRTKWEP